jgi:hypothetical protein
MANLKLREGEVLVESVMAQLAKGFPQTVGKLHLTSQRIVLVPNQLLSIGFGKKLEFASSEVEEIRPLQNFEGGTFAGSAGKKIFIKAKDGTAYTFSLWLTADVDAICNGYRNSVGLTTQDMDTKGASLFDDTFDALLNLKDLLDSGLLSDEEYVEKRRALVDKL